MSKIHIDLETYSSVPIDRGVDRYVSAPDFKILLMGYAFDNDPVQVLDLSEGEEVPPELKNIICQGLITHLAHNAVFEIMCLSKHFGVPLPIQAWECTMVKCLHAGLPAKLERAAEVLELEQRKIKTNLISWFCKPAKNGKRRRRTEINKVKWAQFIEYCRRDVVVERNIDFFLHNIKVDWSMWMEDFRINRRGVGIDVIFVENAISIQEAETARLVEEAKLLTGMNNPNSLVKLKNWMLDYYFVPESLDKDRIAEYLANPEDISPEVLYMMKLRQRMGKTSVKKYDKMLSMVGDDGRIRGLFFFHGTITGRWAGRGVQLQNLYRNKEEMLDVARDMVCCGQDPRALFSSDILSQLIRTSFVGNFAIADFSAIEARVIAWLAEEDWVNQVFAEDGKIYEAQASRMYGLDISEIDSELRSKGKVATLALGYQGSVGALQAMGFEGSEEDALDLVRLWRRSNTKIVKLWAVLQKACMDALRYGQVSTLYDDKLSVYKEHKWLCIRLPSGRTLRYYDAEITQGPSVRRSGRADFKITYIGAGTNTQWTRLDTYGGKLCENVVQAIAADILMITLMRLRYNKVVMHVHDEVVVEDMELPELISIMEKPIDWAPGLILKADGFKSEYYRK